MSHERDDLQLEARVLSLGRDFEVRMGSHRGRPVIVKVAHGEERQRLEAQLAAEARALERLAGSGVAPELVALMPLANGRLALVRSYVEGVPLSLLIERALVRHRWQGARRWNAPTRALVAALLDAVAVVHGAGLVHNDLKPDDVLIARGEDGGFRAVLIDLGLAAADGAGGPGGTVAYAAPERLEGQAGTRKSDVWALGAMLFELLAGTRPYPASQPVDARLERRHAIDALPREAGARAFRHLPEVVQAALAAALHADPRRRPKSVAQLRKALALDAAPPQPRPLERARRARRWSAGLPLLVVVLATALALMLALGPLARALGLGASGSASHCERMSARATLLCHGLSGEAACHEALTATADCRARADLLDACEVP